jgi:DNA-directed RNA polymerase subunit RPC12/RpoP
MPTTPRSSSPQLFHCPTCGAALPPPGDVASVRCEYCNSNVLVPEEYRKPREPQAPPQYAQPVVINIGGDASHGAEVRRSSSIAGLIVTLVIVCVVLGGVGTILSATGVFSALGIMNQVIEQELDPLQETRVSQQDAPPLQEQATPTATVNPGYAMALQFGGEGSGAGQFEDPRFITVAADGSIFVGEFDNGRLQKFDADGKFTAMVNVPPDDQDYVTFSDIAADYSGKVYVARRGDILVFNAGDGAQVGSIPGSFPDTWYDTLAFDPANNLYAFHTSAGELDLIKFDAAGNLVYRKPQVTEGLVPKNKISSVERMAVDGLGNIYMLDRSQYQVYKFDTDGNFVDRFSGKGDGPGLLENVSDLAVDGQGRVYVLNQDGIDIFDGNGR